MGAKPRSEGEGHAVGNHAEGLGEEISLPAEILTPSSFGFFGGEDLARNFSSIDKLLAVV